MPRTADAPGAVLAAGLALAVAAALAPAGLGGDPVPAASWLTWAAVLALAFAGFARAGVTPLATLRRLAWLLPAVAPFVLPASLVAPPGSRLAALAALTARAVASASVAAMLAALLGPAGLVAAARSLRVPPPLVDVLAAALGGLTVVTRQATAMLRAREARRPARGAWARLAVAPRRTLRGFGRLVAALLLRSLERGEALERARRARGVGR